MSELKNLEVGSKLGFYFVSDVYPCTVISVSNNGKSVTVQQNDHGKNKLEWPEQDFPILDTLVGFPKTFTLRKNGRYVQKGTPQDGRPVLTSNHSYYQDPHF